MEMFFTIVFIAFLLFFYLGLREMRHRAEAVERFRKYDGGCSHSPYTCEKCQ